MDKKIFFFGMTVCHHRTGEHIGKRCGVVLADNKEDAECIAWDKYGNDTSCQLCVEEVVADSYDFQFTEVRFRRWQDGKDMLALENGGTLR